MFTFSQNGHEQPHNEINELGAFPVTHGQTVNSPLHWKDNRGQAPRKNNNISINHPTNK